MPDFSDWPPNHCARAKFHCVVIIFPRESPAARHAEGLPATQAFGDPRKNEGDDFYIRPIYAQPVDMPDLRQVIWCDKPVHDLLEWTPSGRLSRCRRHDRTVTSTGKGER
ncbi:MULTISPECIES: hypothetical protein [unclassified Mesorhizobium]|uniref:hypothetical protein n=1 Tax=unclassified Mesorhizobium TaxID=325217 RepID=UPI001679D020|nr:MULTISPECIES: hypothetical protein [unclassified Mesorhizobium]